LKVDVLGISFDEISIEQAVSRACKIMLGGEKAYIVTPNPEIVWLCMRNEALRDAVNGAGMVLPDGIGIIIGARILGTPLKSGRTPGVDFAAALFSQMAKSGLSVFLLGAKPGVADLAGGNLAEKYPGIKIAGTADGYFAEDESVIESVNAAKPSLLLVCLGAPKQELWMAKNSGRLRVPLCAGLGGALDIFAGKAKRAPVFFQRFGIEWLYRIAREPHRIIRCLKLPLFVLAVISKRVFGRDRAAP